MTDNKKVLICPLCAKEMKKIELQDYGFCVDICLDGCGSIVFDNREFQKFDEKSDSIETILAAYKGKEFPQTDTEEDLRCPVCNSKMVKNNANPACKCKIDECYVCGVKFLNYGELLKIKEKSNESDPEYQKALQIVIEENSRLEEQNAKNKPIFKKLQEISQTFFKKR